MIEPTIKPIPSEGAAVAQQWGILNADAPVIYVFEDAMADVLEYSESNQMREVGGFLVGGLHEDGGLFVEVRGFLPAAMARSQVDSVTFTHAAWATMNRQVEQQFPDDLVLGWVHTHPGFGIFLSGYDLFIHRNFFSQPWQISLVVDPRSDELGFFQWQRDRVMDCGFVCVCRKAQ